LSIKNEIFNLEKLLLDNTVRVNPNRVSEILSDNFFEYGSSGKIYYYKPGDVFNPLKNEIDIIDFEIKELSPNIFLATYKTVENVNNKIISNSLRSSIWKKETVRYKIVFHQGTKI